MVRATADMPPSVERTSGLRWPGRPDHEPPVEAGSSVLLRALKDVADGLGVPLATASRCDTSGIQCSRNLPQRRRARLLRLADDGQDVGRKPVGLGRHGLHRALAGHVELWVTKGHPACLCSREGLPGPCADQRALLLGKGGEEVQDERVNVRPKLGDQEGHLVGHEAADEVNVAAEPVQLGHGHVAP